MNKWMNKRKLIQILLAVSAVLSLGPCYKIDANNTGASWATYYVVKTVGCADPLIGWSLDKTEYMSFIPSVFIFITIIEIALAFSKDKRLRFSGIVFDLIKYIFITTIFYMYIQGEGYFYDVYIRPTVLGIILYAIGIVTIVICFMDFLDNRSYFEKIRLSKVPDGCEAFLLNFNMEYNCDDVNSARSCASKLMNDERILMELSPQKDYLKLVQKDSINIYDGLGMDVILMSVFNFSGQAVDSLKTKSDNLLCYKDGKYIAYTTEQKSNPIKVKLVEVWSDGKKYNVTYDVCMDDSDDNFSRRYAVLQYVEEDEKKYWSVFKQSNKKIF